ncbi:hypothetical protein [Nocardioides sp. zg-1228]|uniref:hypothetical protein n=1 Tax=Nocardioides sp. zg-1228 TaxID=2763008 RepID=UPI001643340F|nr:hypothetical protein [Nocardioides sp. zg-1228]MBC2934645.1 hypothetical protein [Nocardioides sp. zg-1228]QSF59390.1 hypothetical protein JX575_09670 [Nocardioides sp. zg-1228]
MLRTVVALAAGTLVAPLATAAPAHAANEVSISMPGGVLYDSCGNYAYSYSAALPAGYASNWDMELRLVGPDGNDVDTDSLSGRTLSGAGDFFLCESPNLAGTYAVIGTGQACNADDECVPISASGSTSFRLPQTRTTLRFAPKRPAKGETIRFVITSKDERPAGYFGTSAAMVRLQARRSGSWRTIRKAGTNDFGKAVIKARYSGRPVKVRAVTRSDGHRTGSASRVVVVR